MKATPVFVLWVTWIVLSESIMKLVEVHAFILSKFNCKHPASNTTSLWPLNTSNCFDRCSVEGATKWGKASVGLIDGQYSTV